MIEECDKMLMRMIFECPQGTPVEAFYIESKFQMKKLVLSGIKMKAQEFLMKLKDSHAKTEQLVPSYEIQEYLTTEELTTAEKRLLFKLKIQKID